MFPDRLLDGYRSFVAGRFAAERDRYEQLAEAGQAPRIMVIGCVDSRVSPEVIFDQAPGELLVVRNVANLAPAYEAAGGTQHGTSAALEFAVQALHVRHIVVLGHAFCGGVAAFATERERLSPGDFIGRWVEQLAPAAASIPPPAPDEGNGFLRRLEMASVSQSLRNLMTFPWIRARVESGELALHGAYFGIASGRLLVRDPATGDFRPVDGAPEMSSPLRCD